ncbi:hypothetical protein CTA2_2190 [Colletotrichum tanaceti]|nr:hypothetical protein CTA2_2193 [Colletotrichum tanaceti]KAJ0167506.1 hypothetical protein CTA2_2190 [Colletotrichum tanaceti]
MTSLDRKAQSSPAQTAQACEHLPQEKKRKLPGTKSPALQQLLAQPISSRPEAPHGPSPASPGQHLRASLSTARISPACPGPASPDPRISSILRACPSSRWPGSPDLQHLPRSPASLGLLLDGLDPLEISSILWARLSTAQIPSKIEKTARVSMISIISSRPARFSMVDTRKIFLAIFGPLARRLSAQPSSSRLEASPGPLAPPPTSSFPGPDSRRPRSF